MGIAALTAMSALGATLLVGSATIASPLATSIAGGFFSNMEEEGKLAYGRGKQLTLILAVVLILAVTAIPFIILPIGWAFLFAVPTLFTTFAIPYFLESRPTYLITAKEKLNEIYENFDQPGNWKPFDMQGEHSLAYFRRLPLVIVEKPGKIFNFEANLKEQLKTYKIPFNKVSAIAVFVLSCHKKNDPKFDEEETDSIIYWKLAHTILSETYTGYKGKFIKIINITRDQLGFTPDQQKDLDEVLNTAPHPLVFF